MLRKCQPRERGTPERVSGWVMFPLLIPGAISPPHTHTHSCCASADDCQWEPRLRKKESRFPFPPNILSLARHPRVPAPAQDQRLGSEEGAEAAGDDFTQHRHAARRTLVPALASAVSGLLPAGCPAPPPRLANPLHSGVVPPSRTRSATSSAILPKGALPRER